MPLYKSSLKFCFSIQNFGKNMKRIRSNLSLPYKVANKLGKLMELARMPIMRLDEQSVCAAATKQTGLTDFGDLHYHQGLLQLLESVEKDAKLHSLGRIMTRKIIVNYLIQRLLFVETQKKEPELIHLPLIPPLIIVGLARSGTTYLHNLLAIDPSHRAIPLWLLTRPFPERPGKGGEPDIRRVKMERSIRFRQPLLTGLDSIHYVRADSPEECINALGLTFNSLIFPILLPVARYMDWYMQHSDAFQKYQEYRWLLQVFQSHEPEQRLTLKAPAHTGNVDALLRAVPNALVVQTHRNPVTCVKSVNNLLYTFHLSVAEEVDIPQTTNLTLLLYEHWLKRNMAFRSENPGVIYDVFYDALVSDPIGTVRSIYNHFGLPWTNVYATRLQSFVKNNPKDKHGKHHYSAYEFGLTEDEIAKQLQFYSEHFGL